MTIHKSNLQQLTQPNVLTSLIQRKQINKPQYRAQGQSIILRTTTRDREITFYATTSTTAKDMQSAMASQLLPGYNYRVIVGFVCFTFHCENQVKEIKQAFHLTLEPQQPSEVGALRCLKRLMQETTTVTSLTLLYRSNLAKTSLVQFSLGLP